MNAPAIALTGARSVAPPAEPGWLRRGPLFISGGVACFDGLIDPTCLAAMCAESQANYVTADRQVCEVESSDGCDGRGGVPPRQLSSAGGGPVQDRLYGSPAMHSFLSGLCGGPIRPTGSRGSYSYYLAEGDHLGLHLDIVTCDVTAITVLTDSSPDHGGSLAVRRDCIDMPLSHARASDTCVEEVVPARAGATIVILGGLVPHRVLPMSAGGQRVISALCFAALPS